MTDEVPVGGFTVGVEGVVEVLVGIAEVEVLVAGTGAGVATADTVVPLVDISGSSSTRIMITYNCQM